MNKKERKKESNIEFLYTKRIWSSNDIDTFVEASINWV